MYHPKMKKLRQLAVVVLFCIRFWHCMLSKSCSECQWESCPWEIEVSYRALLKLIMRGSS